MSKNMFKPFMSVVIMSCLVSYVALAGAEEEKTLAKEKKEAVAAEQSHEGHDMSGHDMGQDMSGHDKMEHGSHARGVLKSSPDYVVSLSDIAPIEAGKDVTLDFRLLQKDGTPVTPDMLDEVHRAKIHTLVIDEGLNDYAHVHPAVRDGEGYYTANVTPQTAHDYDVWVEFTPKGKTAQAVRVMLSGADKCKANCTEAERVDTATVDGVTVTVDFGKRMFLQPQRDYVAAVRVTDKDGKPVTDLEPVMGAYAHVVGFTQARDVMIHMHPIGAEPAQESERGASPLRVKFMTGDAGFMRYYVQIRRGGKDVFFKLGTFVKDPPDMSVDMPMPEEKK